MTEQYELTIRVQATPNPFAWKFILNKPVLSEGKASYASFDEAAPNLLASSLFQVAGVRQVHFFQNVITITHGADVELKEIKDQIEAVIETRLPTHNPDQTMQQEKKLSRATLPAELQAIEEILDRTIRPGLQGDGGDIEIIKLEDNKLYIHYQGACGTCPSATSGTLMAIEGIIRDEFNSQIEVVPI